MIRHWFTRQGEHLEQMPLKRFDPDHWTVDFPLGTAACLTRGSDAHSLVVAAEFLRRGDLVGLIWSSADTVSHPAHARETNRDYSGTKLSFRWQSMGLIPLDQPDGPTLTVEGRDAAGVERSWFVRLWNYADGDPDDAVVSLDFDALYAGWAADEKVAVSDVERLFISLAPPDYSAQDQGIRLVPAAAEVRLEDIECRGAGSVIDVGASWQPAQPFNACTAYDDLYHLPPSRVAEAIDRLGYGVLVTHYVGMSHYMALAGDGLLDSSRGMVGPALRWHAEFARELKARGRTPIWSLSYEILDRFCPESWKQRRADGGPALTAWSPPSTLVSPANADAIDYLGGIFDELVDLSAAEGLPPKVQIGEPWWWVDADGHPCLYDAAAAAAYGAEMPVIGSVGGVLSTDEKALLDWAGAKLSASTATLVARAKARQADTETHLLVYLPSILDPGAPEARRANLPTGWASPAFDVLQLEDYDWVTQPAPAARRVSALREVEARLQYAVASQHYLSGFVLDGANAAVEWPRIVTAADEALSRGTSEVFVWALPQVMRDGITIFTVEENDMQDVADVDFPISLGADASVRPNFSTQVIIGASGHEQRNVDWQQSRNEYDAGPGVRGEEELQTLLAFFRARRGQAEGFRLRDPFDHRSGSGDPSALDQSLGTGDGMRTQFALQKSYEGGEVRRITRPVAGTVRVALDGVEQAWNWTLANGGMVEFDAAPDAGVEVTAGFLFDVPVRFASDQLEINRATFLAGEAPSVPLIEVREG
ncbi:DUF2460 domain-containing protein [Sphingomicrobium aestuariivivum]|uniref:DUF2460 domain-containing protein n=1 Tax=Sphingomicrobium aestuariivivum TaxID=1582356 RepID=UPI001FD67D60|nr:DUF2460 domain-containing protein [Sphingomicrobium aestuariivivum]MCJ8191781.1 DUF2460 domain-containing protein [Sphingomicrobium aestuariivivum]